MLFTLEEAQTILDSYDIDCANLQEIWDSVLSEENEDISSSVIATSSPVTNVCTPSFCSCTSGPSTICNPLNPNNPTGQICTCTVNP